MSIWPLCIRQNSLIPFFSGRHSLRAPQPHPPQRHAVFRGAADHDHLRASSAATTRCHRSYLEDGTIFGVDLEEEILEFMRNSSKPESFPTRKELVEAGRSDLAEAIVEEGGWFSLGWDLENEHKVVGDDNILFENYRTSSDQFGGQEEEDVKYDRSTHKSFLELMDESTEIGIEGILNRLEKERNFAFGFEDGYSAASANLDEELSTFAGFFRINKSTSLDPQKSISHDSEDNIDASTNSNQPQMWTSWNTQPTGLFPQTDDIIRKDIEVTPNECSTDETIDITADEVEEVEGSDSESNDQSEFGILRRKEITQNQLRTRLQHLELELSSVLRTVRANGDDMALKKYHERLSEDLQNIYDSWEFQENEIMKAQDQLRSTRAKLAVLEGKMALAIIEAQKIMEDKQKKIDDARRALRLLYSTCIVWPNPASEVLLAGSFDGWATLRKMEKSSMGIFSLWLQLYPGRYEIKFIVDGEWRTDSHRPIVNNNGHLNNLLIIS